MRKQKVLTPEQQEEIRTKDFFDMILPSTLRFMSYHYTVGDSYRCVWVIREYPPSTEEQAILRLNCQNQATPAAFEKEFEQVKAAGESAVVITLSSKLSGTYQSAIIAVQEYENIYVVDSASAAIGGGILVELALQLLDAGMSAEEIAKQLEIEKQKIVIVALVDTLEYLKQGGRISKTVAFAGSVLNIKPVLSVVDGEINMLGKARGSKQGNNLLVQEIEKAGGVDFGKPVLLGYTGISDALLKKYMEDSKHLWGDELENLRYTTIGSVIGTHAGPGAVAVAFFKK